ncbi:MAG: glycosyltransferase family 2 protein [Candidatus Dormibacteraeota bacterium]|nr:glycosyltransferase family 2 protein [Candidatus Dormibacteraeota bacterium]
MVTAARPAQMATIATPAQGDPDLTLLLPDGDVVDPEVSIVIPALNEEKTVGEFVDWCKEGLARAGVTGEVLIVDSSTDRTTEIALEHGARVLRGPKRGLGRAYIDALPYIRGRYILMGDADCTYDFRDLASFVGRFRQGYEFVMGSRWKGSIEPGSMPPLHQYLGTPVTTWILNVLYSSSFSDIHCGMRGITREALHRMGLQSQSWEYASEMVLKSVHMRLRTAEVPVSFLKDREGRLSHHKRAGWFSPFHAAWINLRAMFVYGAEFFVFKPGLAMLALGLLLSIPLSLGSITVGPVHFSLYWMLLGLTLTVLGLQSFFFGCIAQVLHDYNGAARRRWMRWFPYTRTVLLSVAAFAAGLALSLLLVAYYIRSGLVLSPADRIPYLGVLGLELMMAGFMTFTFVLLLHASVLRGESAYGPH